MVDVRAGLFLNRRPIDWTSPLPLLSPPSLVFSSRHIKILHDWSLTRSGLLCYDDTQFDHFVQAGQIWVSGAWYSGF